MKWPELQFAEVAEIVTGNTPPKKDPDNYGPGVPWAKPPDLDAWEPVIQTAETLSPKGQKLARLLPEGAVMVCCIGSIGRVGIAGTTLTTNQQINSLIFGPRVEPKFGYYYCRFIPQQFQAAARNAVVPILNKSNFSKIPMPLPPLPEQQRIVEILDQANALRKKRAEADAKAAHILPALFYKMFGDPDLNPKDWPKVDLKELGTPLSGGAFPLAEQGDTEAEVPFIKVSDMNSAGNEVYIHSSNNWVSRDTLKRLRVKAAPAGTTVFPKIGAAVATNKKRLLVQDTAYDNNVMGVVPNNPAHSTYIHAFFLLFDLARLTRTTAVPSIKTSELAVLPVPKPDDRLIIEFNRQFRQLLSLQAGQRKSGDNIDRLFSVLLYRAFTGDLTAKWHEAHKGEIEAEMQEQMAALEDTKASKPKRKAVK